MSGDLVDGIRWVLENCTDANGKPFNQSTLSLAAGLSRSHVGLILRGHVKPESLQQDTVDKIAAAAGVTPEFLRSGGGSSGSPSPAATPATATSKSVAIAIASKMRELYSEAAIAGLEATPEPEVDPGLDHWLKLLGEYEDRVLAQRSARSEYPTMERAIGQLKLDQAVVAHARRIAWQHPERTFNDWLTYLAIQQTENLEAIQAEDLEHRNRLADEEERKAPPVQSSGLVNQETGEKERGDDPGRRKKA